MGNKIRIDKWLWAVRVYKTRTQASDACKGGKIKINGISVKASQMLGENEIVEIKKEGFKITYKSIQLIEKRVSAIIASGCYEDLTPPEDLPQKNDGTIIMNAEFRDRGTGRPTKRDRRDIDKFKNI
jgi:ribosome-associated heat shock protein Hsp15